MMKKQTAFNIMKTMLMGTRADQDGTFRMAKHFFDRKEGSAPLSDEDHLSLEKMLEHLG